MDRQENSINNEQSLNPCNEKSPLINKLLFDPVPGKCPQPPEETLKEVSGPFDSWVDPIPGHFMKTGIGQQDNCDPIMTGQIVNDARKPNPQINYRYSRAVRGADEAVMDLFRNLVVIDENGKQHIVPIIWGTQEKAVAFVIQDNTRKDNTLVVDRIRLPLLAIHQTDIQFNQDRYTYSAAKNLGRSLTTDGHPGFTIDEQGKSRSTVFGITRGIPVDISYTLYCWTLYLEDMNQIVEQIFLKFNPVAYINVRGVWWEVIVRLESVGNNIESEVGDQAIRVIKFQFNMTAESYIPQPIERKKAVLKMTEEFVNSTAEETITEVLEKIETAVKEIK